MEVSEILFREINSGDFSKNANVTFLSGRYLMFDKSTEHSIFPEVLKQFDAFPRPFPVFSLSYYHVP